MILEICLRCGFCGIVMDIWFFCIDYFVEYFKCGKFMVDWKGDWGFEDKVLDMVENLILLFLIYDERNLLDFFEVFYFFFVVKNVYEFIKVELRVYIDD